MVRVKSQAKEITERSTPCFRASVLPCLAVVLTLGIGVASAQTPQPFPRPSEPPAPVSAPPAAPVSTPAAPPAAQPAGADGAPTEAMLGAPIYPASTYLGSYDAGRGQRFYLFGVLSSYDEMVTYYQNVLRDRGDRLYPSPPTHMFETGRFRDETMAFPPSVTIKDYTFGGSQGFANPVPGAEPAYFPTVVQIVNAPPVP